MIIREFGWVPPPPEKRTAHDVLPLLLQVRACSLIARGQSWLCICVTCSM